MSLSRISKNNIIIRFFPLYAFGKQKYFKSFIYISRSLRFLNSLTFLHLLDLSIASRNPQLFSHFIALNLNTYIRNIRFFLRFIDRLMNLFITHYGFRGVKMSIKGRLNGARRARFVVIQKGKIPLNTLSSNILYGFSSAMTIFGVCSIKVWLYI